ncbi:hypothetical protein [Streptomyces sp. NPDC127084]|uniref:hypothetical protein n=1 Tax=Streptomyces sp. NPDC127084 TaxID=3347133 RepID=UPI0036518620
MGARVFGRLLVRTGTALVVAGTLLAAGPGVQEVKAASGCSGRPVKTVKFATGELRLYKHRAYVCAVTIAKRPGARRAMSVSLQPRGGRAAVDKGRFTRQAGPVTVYALNRSVRASGAVAGAGATTGWILL